MKKIVCMLFVVQLLPVFAMESPLPKGDGVPGPDQDEQFNQQIEAVRCRNFEQLNLDIRNCRGETLLIKGIRSFWKIEVIKQLIDAGVDVNAKDNDGYTALILAAWAGRSDLVKLLLSQGANVHAQLLRKDAELLIGTTALMMAVDNGKEDEDGTDTEVVGMLVDAGADMCTQKNDAGVWALQMAVLKGKTEAFKRMLIVAVAQDETFLTRFQSKEAFFGAALMDNSEILQTMLRLGMNPNTQHEEGWTALYAAAQEGSLKAMKALLSAGGDLAFGHTKWGNVRPYDIARMNGKQEMVEFLDRFVEALLACIRDIYRGCANDDILLQIRANFLLLNAPCTLNVDNVGGSTLLMRAIRRGNFALCDALLKMGALPHLKNGNGCTALDIARSMEHGEPCGELIKLYEQKNTLRGEALLKLWLMDTDQLQKTIGGMSRSELEAINVPFIITERVQLRELPE